MSTPESYIIQHADGNRYGPVELETLKAWAATGRIAAQTSIQIVSTAEVVPYAQLTPPAPPAEAPPLLPLSETPPNYVNYPRGYQPPMFATLTVADKELKNSWMFFWLALGVGSVGSLICGIAGFAGPILSILGISAANKATAAGHPNARGAKTANIVVLVLSIIAFIGIAIFIAMMFQSD